MEAAAEALPVDPRAGVEPDDDPLIGTTLAGTYRIERRVAEGGMGRLYEGRHTRLQMTVAVKTLRELRGGRPEAIARAEREARAMASIVSPHVARVLDLVRTPDGRPCLVTELLEGEDLEQRLARDGKLPAREAARIARDVARGLAVAHAAGVLHRDIKPSNVFLTRDGQVKLLDFGVAKLEDTEALTHAGAFLGTPAYMSPEQASSASDVDERSDVYGLGAILYEMLGGQRPYGDLDTTQTLTRLLRGEPPRLTALERSVPEGLASVVEHAMSRERDDRFAGAAEMADALVPWADGGEARRSERSARWLRPEAVGAVLTASLLAGLWAAALLYEVGRVVDAFETWPAWALGVGRAVPAAALAVALALGVRSLVRRWRSAPRVGALLTGLRRTVWIAAAALGALEAGRLAARLYELRTPMGRSEETVVALGLAAGVAMVAAAVTARLGARRPAERADG